MSFIVRRDGLKFKTCFEERPTNYELRLLLLRIRPLYLAAVAALGHVFALHVFRQGIIVAHIGQLLAQLAQAVAQFGGFFKFQVLRRLFHLQSHGLDDFVQGLAGHLAAFPSLLAAIGRFRFGDFRQFDEVDDVFLTDFGVM